MRKTPKITQRTQQSAYKGPVVQSALKAPERTQKAPQSPYFEGAHKGPVVQSSLKAPERSRKSPESPYFEGAQKALWFREPRKSPQSPRKPLCSKSSESPRKPEKAPRISPVLQCATYVDVSVKEDATMIKSQTGGVLLVWCHLETSTCALRHPIVGSDNHRINCMLPTKGGRKGVEFLRVRKPVPKVLTNWKFEFLKYPTPMN